MVEVFEALERNALSVWIREFPSVFGFPTILFLHTLGLAMVAGVSIAIDLWILRDPAPGQPPRMLGLVRTMWLGFGINAVSGVALLLAYPAKALTNWVFYLKMGLVLLGVYLAARINREVMRSDRPLAASRRLATASLLVWAAAIVTGRLLAYTHSVLFASELR